VRHLVAAADRAAPARRPQPRPVEGLGASGMPRKRASSSSTSPSRAPSGTTTREVSLAGRDFRLIRVGTSGDIERRRGARLAVVPQGRRDRRERRPRGRRPPASSRRPARDASQVRGHDARVPVRTAFDARRRPAGVGDPPRPGRDAGLLLQRPRRRRRPRNHERTIAVLREFTANIDFEDPAAHRCPGRPFNTNPVTAKAAQVGMYVVAADPRLRQDHGAHGPVGG
jgi:hypothetical protein